MRPGAKKSIVWIYFRKTGNTSAKCILCKKTIKCYGGTSNLRQHLLRIHPIEMSQNENENESNISISVDQSTSSAATQPQQISPSTSTMDDVKEESSHISKIKICNTKKILLTKPLFCGKKNKLSESQISKIDEKLLKMIAKDFQPLSFVENKGFLEFSKELQPLYKVPSRKRLSTVILPCYYTEAALTLKTSLGNVKNMTVSTDIWTSDSNISYITLTAHYILDDLLHARVLSTKEIYGSHTGDNIANVLRLILTEWNIGDKIVAVISDNGRNIRNAITEHLDKEHLPCFAHTLNLCVNEALSSNDKINIVLKKCRTLADHFKHNISASDTLKSIQEQMGLPLLKMKQDVVTIWNSCYIMLEQYLEIKNPLSVCITNLPNVPVFLDPEEWTIIYDCVQVLKPANLLTIIFSGETYPTISLIVPLIKGLQSSVKNVNTCTNEGAQLQQTLLDVVSRRLGILESNKIIAKASFLDPRFKKIGFGAEDNATNAQTWVTEELSEIFACQQVSIKYSEEVSLEPQNPGFNEDDLWSHFDQKLFEKKIFTTPTSMATLMVTQYLEVPAIERQADPLVFWAKHKNLLPEMYQLAMKYLCISSTSVSSERMFSKTGLLTNLRRNRLDPKQLDEIIFLNSQ